MSLYTTSINNNQIQIFITNYLIMNSLEEHSEWKSKELIESEDQQENSTADPSMMGKTKHEKAKKLPSAYYKAKRTLTRMINQYFSDLKNQWNSNQQAGVEFTPKQVTTVRLALQKCITIRYKLLQQLNPIKNPAADDFLLHYLPETKSLLKYTNQQKTQTIKFSIDENIELPDLATPAPFASTIYFFDGAKMDDFTGSYLPLPYDLRLNTISKQLKVLQNSNKLRKVKCAIVKNQKGFYILGGHVGHYKVITKKCQFFNIRKQVFQDFPQLNAYHPCPSACIHKNSLCLVSEIGIQLFQNQTSKWIKVQVLNRFYSMPFQYCISVSDKQIAILGGKQCNRSSHTVSVINLENKKTDIYPDVLPVGISSERSWGPTIMFGHIVALSSLQASVYPQVSLKGGTSQVVYFGSKGCFIKSLIFQQK